MNELCVSFETVSGTHMFRLEMSGHNVSTAPLPFEPFLSEKDFEDLRWYLEEYLELPVGGSVVRAHRVEKEFMEWGRRLHDVLFASDEGREMLQSLLDAEAPRVLTVATDNALLLQHPWELIASANGPLTRLGVTVRRRLGSSTAPPVALRPPVRILLVVSRPEDAGFIDPRVTSRQALDALSPLGGDVIVDFCRPPTFVRLRHMLEQGYARGEPYHVLHFDGHGDCPQSTSVGELYFEAEPSVKGVQTHRVNSVALGALLSQWPVALTILEACRSSKVGQVTPVLSVAPALLTAGVHSVVAMSHVVQIEATRILLGAFYRHLSTGATVGQALEAGRAALFAHPVRWQEPGSNATPLELQDWFLPQLYQSGYDIPLVFRGGPGATPGDEDSRKFVGPDETAFPPAPRYGFHGRALELHRLEQTFRRSRATVLCGMGGMGKTSLAREAALWWARSGLFPDGVCFLSFEHGGGPERIVQALGTSLDGPEFLRLTSEEQRRRAGELFQERRVLMVWDNFESVLAAFDGVSDGPTLYDDRIQSEIARIYRELTSPATGNGRLLVTCRSPQTGLQGAELFELGGLLRADSKHLLTSVMRASGVLLGDQRLSSANLNALLDVLGDHPLSIELVGPHLRTSTPEEITARFRELLPGFTGDARDGRNRSLMASLAFSAERLSSRARDILPWFGVFRVGVFEEIWLSTTRMDPVAWTALRAEFEGLGLIRIERGVLLAERPYIRLHPTLPHLAASFAPLPDPQGARQQFMISYLHLCYNISRILASPGSLSALIVLEREEANLRNAVQWTGSDSTDGGAFASMIGTYLEQVGRLSELSAWTAWVAARLKDGGFTEAVARAERNEAWSLFSQGCTAEAVRRLEALIARLQTATGFDPRVECARACGILGRIYAHAGFSERAVRILQDVVKANEDLLAGASEESEHSGEPDLERDSLVEGLSNALLDLAHALKDVGRLDQAEAAARHQVGLSRAPGQGHNLAVGLHRLATILMDQGRLREAGATYAEAIVAVRLKGDVRREAIILQGAGAVAHSLGESDRAVDLWKESLLLSQQMNDEAEVMRTCNLLGVAEEEASRLPEARAWFAHARQIAEARGDKQLLGAVLTNTVNIDIGEGLAARTNGDESAAHRYFQSAVSSASHALAIWEELENRPHAAMAYGQLARAQLQLGRPEEAARNGRRALEIAEGLGLTANIDIYYQILSETAQALGDQAGSADWERKKKAVGSRRHAEEQWPPEMVAGLGVLAMACGQAGLRSSPIPPSAEQILSQIEGAPPPFLVLGSFLRSLSHGKFSEVPTDLPLELQSTLKQVVAALKVEGLRP
jgi:tetratricopeptide (TPR) repeat protein